MKMWTPLASFPPDIIWHSHANERGSNQITSVCQQVFLNCQQEEGTIILHCHHLTTCLHVIATSDLKYLPPRHIFKKKVIEISSLNFRPEV